MFQGFLKYHLSFMNIIFYSTMTSQIIFMQTKLIKKSDYTFVLLSMFLENSSQYCKTMLRIKQKKLLYLFWPSIDGCVNYRCVSLIKQKQSYIHRVGQRGQVPSYQVVDWINSLNFCVTHHWFEGVIYKFWKIFLISCFREICFSNKVQTQTTNIFFFLKV